MNQTKNQPSTPLPWDHNGLRLHYSIDSEKTGQRVAEVRNCKGPNGHDTGLDARYIAIAANAYPKLVALAKLVPDMEGDVATRALAKRLLRELGEAE